MINGATLFSNVGVDEIYLKKAGVKIVLANELIKKRADFYNHIYPDVKMIQGDITDQSIVKDFICEFKKNDCKFLLATPPCQGMSVAGKMDPNDIRNELIKTVIEVVKKTKPDYVMIENVPGILKFQIDINGSKILIKDFITNNFKSMGYNVKHGIFDACDYGTPQYRKRALFLISKNKIWESPSKQNVISLEEAIGDLPSLLPGEKSDIKYHVAKKHNERHRIFMMNTPTGKSAHFNTFFYPKRESGERIKGFSTTYKRMEWSKPAPTVTMANGSISSQNNVHPGRLLKDGTYSDPRVLTILELMRITGLPDNWNVPSWASENLIRQVLGESFPPKFALEFVKMLNLNEEDKNEK